MNKLRLIHYLTLWVIILNSAGCQTHRFPSTGTTASNSLAAQNYAQLQNNRSIYAQALRQPWPALPPTLHLRLGEKNPTLALLRQRLRITGDLPTSLDQGNDDVWDKSLMTALARFQAHHGLKADGILGEQTAYELNISPEQRLRQIDVNIQRWAALSHQLDNRYILVNIPDFHLYLFDHNQPVLSMKAVVGRPSRPTPELSSTINRIVFYPYWNVPASIAQKDIIPKVINDPNYLTDMHFKILDRQDDQDNAKIVDPSHIDWHAAADNKFMYSFRQDPGLGNSLGIIKFEFENNKDIYLHDTPAKNLFGNDSRPFSSGCIRLEKPFDLVNYLMDNEWSKSQLPQILETGKTKYIEASHPIPIIITYVTVWVDDQGALQFRDDIYGLDATPSDANKSI